MKYLFFLPHYPSFCWSGVYGIILDQVEILAHKGNQITLIYCSDCKTIGACHHIHKQPQAVCRLCNFHKNYLLHHLSKNIELVPLSNFSNYVNKKQIDFHYDSVQDIKNLQYKEVHIGYAAFSTYLSFIARNLAPSIDNKFKTYFDSLLLRCCRFTDIVEAAINQYQPDSVGLFNARLIDNRPIVDICKLKHIDYTSYEHKMVLGNQPLRTYFHNSTPHDVDEITKQINQDWFSTETPTLEKISLSKKFFENRRNAIAAGDKVYIKDQLYGLLPKSWDNKKHNIVIFNSSEDEFASIGESFEQFYLFPSQLIGLKTIFERHQNDNDIHFYLRVHPNLKNVPYLFHTLLLSFGEKYPNVTVIPSTSPISTYSLIDAADKVIVFGSTTGAESVYWGKPTILLGNATYRKLDICYIPKDYEEMDALISNKSLSAKNKEGALKFGYHFLSSSTGQYDYFKVENKVYHIGSRPIRIQSYCINNSHFSKIYTSLTQFFCKLIYEIIPKREVPKDEDSTYYSNIL